MKAEKQTDALRAAFHERMPANNMYGLWELASQMTRQPHPKMIAHMWPWSTLEPIISESTSAVPVGDERRALQLFNPGLDGRWATTNNLIAAVQVLLPGEVARAKRELDQAFIEARSVRSPLPETASSFDRAERIAGSLLEQRLYASTHGGVCQEESLSREHPSVVSGPYAALAVSGTGAEVD